MPRNRLIADVFFMAGYIEAWGRGIDIMLEGCREYGMPEPLIVEEQGGIAVSFLKDLYTEEYLKDFGLEDRQVKALLYIKQSGSITNSKYQELLSVSKRTATNDLQLLVEKELITKVGSTGRGTSYILQQRGNKGAKLASKGQ